MNELDLNSLVNTIAYVIGLGGSVLIYKFGVPNKILYWGRRISTY
jgi:hypothetical protein